MRRIEERTLRVGRFAAEVRFEPGSEEHALDMLRAHVEFSFATEPIAGLLPAVTLDGKRLYVEAMAVYPHLAIPDGEVCLAVRRIVEPDPPERAVPPYERLRDQLRKTVAGLPRERRLTVAEEISREFRRLVGGEWGM